LGKRIIPKEIRNYNALRDQLIDALQQDNDAQEKMIESQSKIISELLDQIKVLEETILLMEEKQQPEKELEN